MISDDVVQLIKTFPANFVKEFRFSYIIYVIILYFSQTKKKIIGYEEIICNFLYFEVFKKVVQISNHVAWLKLQNRRATAADV